MYVCMYVYIYIYVYVYIYIYIYIYMYIYKQIKLKRRKDELFHCIFALRSVSPEGSSGTKGFFIVAKLFKRK